MKKIVKLTENDLTKIVKRVIREGRDHNITRQMSDPKSIKKYSQNTNWSRDLMGTTVEKLGPVTVYITPDDKKVAYIDGVYYADGDHALSKEEAEEYLGQSLD